MLWLRRNTNPYQLEKCGVSGELIAPGDFYYVDDEDGLIIKATIYKELKDRKKEDEWDYSKLNNAVNEYEYRNMLKEATRQMLYSSVLDRKVSGKYDPTPESNELKELYSFIKGGK